MTFCHTAVTRARASLPGCHEPSTSLTAISFQIIDLILTSAARQYRRPNLKPGNRDRCDEAGPAFRKANAMPPGELCLAAEAAYR
jgi:hypothetical protein